MDFQTKKILLEAHRENRIAAVHVDFQKCFLDQDTRAAFKNVPLIADTMRQLKIPNIWIAFNNLTDAAAPISLVGHQNKSAYHTNYKIIPCARACDTVISKYEASAFHLRKPSVLEMHLDMLGIDTVLIDGVLSDSCVHATLEDGILMDKFNFIAISDGMDWRDNNIQSAYVKSIRQLASGPLKRAPFEMTDLATFRQVLA